MSITLCTTEFEPAYSTVHNLEMMTVPEILDALREAAKVKQAGLGELIGISQGQVSRLLKGADPRKSSLDKIMIAARKYAVLREDLRSEDVAALIEPPRKRMVKLKGYVGAGSEAHYYALADEDYEEIVGPEGATDQTVALEIKGTSLGPLLETWRVFYDDIHSPVSDQLIGQTCVVGLADDRVLIKKIERDSRGRFRLISNHAELPIEDAQIEWAAKVIDMKPR